MSKPAMFAVVVVVGCQANMDYGNFSFRNQLERQNICGVILYV